MIEINQNTVFVQGLCNGAIYNFNDGEIYSINNESCKALTKYINNETLKPEETEYINLLRTNELISDDFSIHEYIPQKTKCKLNLCWLELTQRCNCRCIHCYEGECHISNDNTLSLDEWKNIINQISEAGVSRVVIIGGEPCLHKNVEEIVEYTATKGINTTLFTNGTCISDSLKDTIIKNKVKVKFSLYGHNAEVHEKVTKINGSFSKTIDAIKFFLNNGIDVNVAVVLMRENEKFKQEIATFLHSMGVKHYRFDVIREVFGGTQNEHVPIDEDIINSVKQRTPVFNKVNKEKFDSAYYNNTCWNGKLVVCEDGKILPCVFERNIILGNVREKPIADIIQSTATKNCWMFSFEKIEECKNCEYRFACKDCRPLALANNNCFAQNPRCTYDVKSGEWK